MLGPVARQIARWLAILLLGSGIGGAMRLAGLADAALLAGAIAALVGGAYVVQARIAWTMAVVRSRRSLEPFQVDDELSRNVPRAVAGGLFGVGLVLGSQAPSNPLVLVVGLAGLIVLGLTWDRPVA
jgi:hypothetical protein